MPDSTPFTYDSLPSIGVSQLCEANYSALKNVIQTAPEEVQNELPRLPRAVYMLLAIVLSLRERLQNDSSQTIRSPHTNGPNDTETLESLMAMSVDEVEELAIEKLSKLVTMASAALRSDETLQPREFDDTDASIVTRLVMRWQQQATKAALERRDTAIARREPELAREIPDVSHNSDLGIKKQKVLRIAGVPTGEQEDDAQDFRFGLGRPTYIRPSQLGRYPGKTAVLLNVQELMGPSILYSFCQEGINIELAVRNVRWPRQSDGRPFSSEIEAVTLARCLHFQLCRFSTMEESIITAPWTEIALRKLWALLEVQTLTSGPSPLTREEAWQQVLPSLEVYPDIGIRVPAMRSVVNRQISAASRARNAVKSLTKRSQTHTQKFRKPNNDDKPDQPR